VRVGIAIGANVGDRLSQMQRGIRLLLERVEGAGRVGVGGLYETAPVDCPEGSGAFYNSVVVLETELPAKLLLKLLQGIERMLGRDEVRSVNAPRPLDLDILFYGDEVIREEGLEVPHPRLHLRRFVLAPLADVMPELRLPGYASTVAELLAGLDCDPAEVVRVREEWL
jgi:2-amino-4-hydroxy-6-hydroxymethyldihydropteridine diphosphokinase